MKYLFLLLSCFVFYNSFSQKTASISGKVAVENKEMQQAFIELLKTQHKTQTDSLGNLVLDFELKDNENKLNEVVVSGTLKAVKRLESAVPVEVYSPIFFKKNPTASIYEALQNVNGVRPQLNCGVCNTGDIHINGLEGPYTSVMIDGMPIVSSLSTVYGLSGIPNSLVERIEIVKGPASSLYGSEAVGGLINIITKNPVKAPLFSFDVFTSSWLETNADLGVKFNIKKATSLLGLNYYNYNQTIDNDNDGFTDVTAQNRISVFNKWNFQREKTGYLRLPYAECTKIVGVVMCVGRKNTVAAMKFTAKVFIPNGANFWEVTSCRQLKN